MSARQTYSWSNVQLSPAQIAQVVRQAGITDPGLIAQFVSIAQRESGGRAGIHGSASPQSSVQGDRGLFQINYVHDRALMAAGIIRQPSDLFDPVINARAAAYLSQGGNRSAMGQLWGAAGGTWTGSSGSLPAPNYGAVQQAQSSGLFNQPFRGDASSPFGAGLGGRNGGGTAPGGGAAEAYYNSLYAGFDTQLGLAAAQAQMQSDFARRQQGFSNQLAGYQQQGLNLQGQQLGLENQYQNDLALLNRNLSKTQQATNAKDWKAIAANIASLQELARKGLTQDKRYRDATVKLESDIYKSAQKWADTQKGFNQEDYQLALQALRNVVTTAAATYGQKVKESAFVDSEQTRQANSQATAKGALTSKGHGEDLHAFDMQHTLANSGAANELADVNRQAATARGRANLAYRQTGAGIGHDYQQAGFDYRGNVLTANQQYNNANLNYQQNAQNLGFQRQQAYSQYQQNAANLTAQQQMAARTQAYNNATYGINQAQLNNTGLGYQTQLGMQQAGTSNALDMYQVGFHQTEAAINGQRQQAVASQIGSFDPWSPMSGVGSAGRSNANPFSSYSTSRRNSASTSRTGGGWTAQGG